MPTSSEIRAQLSHPVIDADGHVLEYLPAVEPYLREALGPKAFERYRSQSSPLARIMDADNDRRIVTRTPQSAWWGTPARNVRDLATAAAPALMYDRMDELGLDYAVLFPTKGFGIAGIADDELRAGVCRGFNEFYATTYGGYGDRMTAAGVIPMHTPTEALEEMRHCAAIGLKVVELPRRRDRASIAEPETGSPFLWPGQQHWFDNFGLDSEYDYDPVWALARELGFAVTFHGGLGNMASGSFTSVSNYSFNHVGSFAQRMHHLVKSLFMGGVTRRFPDSGFAVLECGVGWAAILLNDLLDHWEKRRPEGLEPLDPAGIDWDRARSADARARRRAAGRERRRRGRASLDPGHRRAAGRTRTSGATSAHTARKRSSTSSRRASTSAARPTTARSRTRSPPPTAAASSSSRSSARTSGTGTPATSRAWSRSRSSWWRTAC